MCDLFDELQLDTWILDNDKQIAKDLKPWFSKMADDEAAWRERLPGSDFYFSQITSHETRVLMLGAGVLMEDLRRREAKQEAGDIEMKTVYRRVLAITWLTTNPGAAPESVGAPKSPYPMPDGAQAWAVTEHDGQWPWHFNEEDQLQIEAGNSRQAIGSFLKSAPAEHWGGGRTWLDVALEAMESAAGGKRGKPQKKRRRQREPSELTDKQLEAAQIVGQHKGNIAAAARALGKDYKTVQQHYERAMEKMGKNVLPKPKTRSLSRDKRGQEMITKDKGFD